MKYLNTLIDNLLNREYKLYQVNARDIYERLNRSYKITKVKLQMFNSETKLSEKINRIKLYRRRGFDRDSSEANSVKEIISKIEKNEHISKMSNLGATFGYELMPIAISVEGDFEDSEAKIELIDGFRRMFCVSEVPDVQILVKVYGMLDDKEWINSMIIYNSWKFSKGEKSTVYMDRGFQLGLYHRYGLKLYAMELMYYDIFKLLDIYTQGTALESYSAIGSSSKTYLTLWNNNQFANDLMSLYKIFTYVPVFRRETKKGIEEYDGATARKSPKSGVSRLYEVFVSLIGEIRKYEYTNGIINRKPFDMDIFYSYLSDKKLQKEFLELCSKTVDGHIVNRINDRLREGIKERVYLGMGYEYVPPEPKIVLNYGDIKDLIF